MWSRDWLSSSCANISGTRGGIDIRMAPLASIRSRTERAPRTRRTRIVPNSTSVSCVVGLKKMIISLADHHTAPGRGTAK